MQKSKIMEAKKITVIIPLHEINDNVEAQLKTAVESVDTNKNELMFVGPKDVISKAAEMFDIKIALVENDNTDFNEQINKGVYACLTPYFTILEYDDMLMPIWNRLMEEEMHRDATVTAPISLYVYNGDKDGNNAYSHFVNEIAWDAFFIEEGVGEVGYVTYHELEPYNGYAVSGAIIKTDDFISLGCLKPEYSIAAWYEFLLRCAFAKKKIFIAPKVAYKHILHEGSASQSILVSDGKEKINKLFADVLGMYSKKVQKVAPVNQMPRQ